MGKKEKSLRRNSHVVYMNITIFNGLVKKKKKKKPRVFLFGTLNIDSLSYTEGKCVSKRLIIIWKLL